MRTGSIPALAPTTILLIVTALSSQSARVHAQAEGTDAPASPDGEAPESPPADSDAVGSEVDAATQAEIDAALAEDAPHCSGTGIEGVVRDAQTQETLIEAPVIVVGRGTRVLTDYDGRFAIDLPPGTYSLRSYYDLYQPARVDDVVVSRGACSQANLELSLETSTGEEIVIEVRAERGTEASQLRMRRESAAVQDAISSQEIRRSPDSTASEVVRRIVGVTTRDDFVYIRGLGGRYVTTLLNGVTVPSTDPDVAGVQLDVFPAALLESVTVRKTFTPDLPGAWAGGLMNIQTQSYPTDFQLRMNLGFGVNFANTFQETLGYDTGGLDFLGFDDGTRALPEQVASTDLQASGITREQLQDASLSFPNSWGVRDRISWPNISAGFSMGDTVDVGGHLLGYMVVAGYRYTERPLPDIIASVQLRDPEDPSSLQLRESLRQEGVRRVAQLSALGTVTYELAEHHRVTAVGLFSQNADDFASTISGRSENTSSEIIDYRISWVQRTLGFGQILGEHTHLPGDARLNWQLNLSSVQRDQPDLRDLRYVVNEEGLARWAPSASSGQRFYSELDDITYGGGVDFAVPFDRFELRAGGLASRTERDFTTRRFNWRLALSGDPSVTLLPPDQLFAPENLQNDLRISETSRDDDSYYASQTLFAGYATLEWRPISELRFAAGLRGESFRQIVESSPPFPSPNDVVTGTRRTDVDPLPVLSAVVEPIGGMFVRASYAGTVARPLVRELAPFLFVDFVRRRTVTGNPDLERTYVHNFDLRWEWFPSESEVLAVSGFVKLFESPIEQTIVTSAGDLSFANIEGAENFGAELEARVHLGHLVPDLDWISVGTNVTLVYSRAQLSDEQRRQATSSERPLAGQPPYVINVSLGFAPPDTGLSFHAYYNVFGPRLEDVGLQGIPDVYQQPWHTVDATVRWDVTDEFGLSLAGRNLIYQRIDLTQGGFVVQGWQPGTTLVLSASYSP